MLPEHHPCYRIFQEMVSLTSAGKCPISHNYWVLCAVVIIAVCANHGFDAGYARAREEEEIP